MISYGASRDRGGAAEVLGRRRCSKDSRCDDEDARCGMLMSGKLLRLNFIVKQSLVQCSPAEWSTGNGDGGRAGGSHARNTLAKAPQTLGRPSDTTYIGLLRRNLMHVPPSCLHVAYHCTACCTAHMYCMLYRSLLERCDRYIFYIHIYVYISIYFCLDWMDR